MGLVEASIDFYFFVSYNFEPLLFSAFTFPIFDYPKPGNVDIHSFLISHKFIYFNRVFECVGFMMII